MDHSLLKDREKNLCGEYRIIKVEKLPSRGRLRHAVLSVFEGNGLLDNEGLPLSRMGEKCSFRKIFNLRGYSDEGKCNSQLLKLSLEAKRNHKNVFFLSGDKISKNASDILFS